MLRFLQNKIYYEEFVVYMKALGFEKDETDLIYKSESEFFKQITLTSAIPAIEPVSMMHWIQYCAALSCEQWPFDGWLRTPWNT